MSQVIVTDDKLKQKRELSRSQEHNIDREGAYKRWVRSDVTKIYLFERLVGFAVLPIVALWALLTGAITLALIVLRTIFRGIGKVVGGSRDLIVDGKGPRPVE